MLCRKTEDAGKKMKNMYQRVQIEPKYFTNQDHFFSYWVLISCSSSNNERIVDIHPSKLYMWIWFWHRWKFLPCHPIIEHIDIAIHNLHKQNVVLKRRGNNKDKQIVQISKLLRNSETRICPIEKVLESTLVSTQNHQLWQCLKDNNKDKQIK